MQHRTHGWLKRTAILAVLAGWCLAGGAGCDHLLPGQGSVVPAPESGTADESGPVEAAQWSGEVVSIGQLPVEVKGTLQVIEDGGPFPYSQDGTVFHNYEGLLPPKPDGYYREFTVPTPGSPDRGARRIVVGESGERYYTDDHYTSFRLVVE